MPTELNRELSDAEINARIAERVFGYKIVEGRIDTGDYGPHGNDGPMRDIPHYTTNAEASKQLRAKLAETYYWQLNLVFPGRFRFALLEKGTPTHPFGAEADTEERAVALCALKAVE